MSIPRQGIIVPLVTPFTATEDVDEEGFRRNVAFLTAHAVHGFVVLPTAGEAPSLTLDEKRRLIDAAIEEARRKRPVIVGCGGLNIRETEVLIRYAEGAGAAGLFVISPYFYKLSREEYLSYYRRVARSTALELLIYNSTYANVPLTLEMIEELVDEPNIVALKEGNQLQLGDAVRRVGDRLSIFTSRDIYIYETLALGGHGAIAFSANVVPDVVVAIFDAASRGDVETARRLQFRLNPLIWKLVSRSYPAPLKAAMDLVGLRGGRVRAPLSNLTAEEIGPLQEALRQLQDAIPASTRVGT